MVISDGGTAHISLFKLVSCLWQRQERGTNDQPDELPFSLRLPLTCEEGVWNNPLPPSYEIQLTGIPGLRAVVQYNIWVIADTTTRVLRKSQV